MLILDGYFILQDYWTPLHWGVQSRNLDLVKLLVENGANMDIVNKVEYFCLSTFAFCWLLYSCSPV